MDITKLNRQEKKEYILEQINELVQAKGGLVQTAEIQALGIDYRRILRFVEEGSLIRIKNGYYTTKYFEFDSEEAQI